MEKELRETIDAEEQHFRKQRMELQEVMGMTNEKKRVESAGWGPRQSQEGPQGKPRGGELGVIARGLEDVYPRDVGKR